MGKSEETECDVEYKRELGSGTQVNEIICRNVRQQFPKVSGGVTHLVFLNIKHCKITPDT